MKLFITGASGFIGGAVAASMARAGHQVRGLIRNPDRAAELRGFGIEPVLGTLDDAAQLAAEARAADAVINAADSDHRGAVEALLGALAGSGKAFIHTSGSSLVADDALGEPSDAVFDETTPVAPVPGKVARIAINDLIHASAPGVRSVVLCHTLIYGSTEGPRAASVQIPPLVAQARESGIARHVGRGLQPAFAGGLGRRAAAGGRGHGRLARHGGRLALGLRIEIGDAIIPADQQQAHQDHRQDQVALFLHCASRSLNQAVWERVFRGRDRTRSHPRDGSAIAARRQASYP